MLLKINNHRIQIGLNELVVSENLVASSNSHLNTLIEEGYISHRGGDNLSLKQRAKKAGATALTYGEIIGFSPNKNSLFNAWLDSVSHKKVIEEPRWTLVGISLTKYNDTYISVINFSSGNLISTKAIVDNETIVYEGLFIEKPTFVSGNEVFKEDLNENSFKLRLRGDKARIIRVYNEKNSLTDMIELFF